MNLVCLELTQQVVNLLRLRNEIGRPYECLPTEGVTLTDVRKQVLDIENTTNIVDATLIDRDTTVVILHNIIYNIFE